MFLSNITEGISQFFNSNTMDEPQESNENYGFYASVISGTLIGGYLAYKLLSKGSLTNPITSLKNRILGINKELLFKASQEGNVAIVEKCLKAGIDVNSINSFGYSVLHLAIMHRQEEVVKILLENGALPYLLTYGGNSALHTAIVSLGEAGNSAPHEAIISSANIAKLLLKKDFLLDVQNNKGDTALHLATSVKQRTDMVAVLLQNGASPNISNNEGETPLHLAVLKDDLDSVAFLLKANANVNHQDKNGHTALHLAVLKGDIVSVNMLLNAGADVNMRDKEGNTALHLAAYHHKSGYCALLLEVGADVNLQNKNGRTALHLVFLGFVESRKLECCQLLLKAGANINLRDKLNRTVLDLAIPTRDPNLVKLLLSADSPDENGHTSLHLAVLKGDIVSVVMLINAGADVNRQDKNGRTALHLAAASRIKEIVEILVKNNANVNALDDEKSKALDYVQPNSEIGKLLSDKMSESVKVNDNMIKKNSITQNFEKLGKKITGFFN